jgi:hypothetical protein
MEPTRGGSNISPLVTIRIPFNREVDEERVEAGLIIEPEPLVAPVFGWEQNTLLAEVVLTPDELHSVRIEASDLIDWQGRILSQEAIVWSFRTATINQFAGFGYGPRLQALQLGSSPNDRPTVEYSFLNRQQPVPVTFELYEMTFADWQASPALAEHDISEQLPLMTWEEAAPPTKPELYFLTNQTLIPEGVAPGFYRLRMKAFGFPQDDLAIILTDLALAVRTKDDTL